MTSHFLSMVFTPAVKAAQRALGSRDAYVGHDGATQADGLTENETAFIAARVSFYLATVSETGWPYLQHRGGPKGLDFAKASDVAAALADAAYKARIAELENGQTENVVPL